MAFQDLIGFQGLSSPEGYWRVGQISIDTSDLFQIRLSVRLDGYASEQARDEGNSAIESLFYDFILTPENTGAVEAQLVDGFRGWIYNKLGEVDRWQGKPEV